VNGDVSFNSTLQVDGDVSFNASLDVSGTVNASKFQSGYVEQFDFTVSNQIDYDFTGELITFTKGLVISGDTLGIPTGSAVPTNDIYAGYIFYDTANSKFMGYDGSSWNELGGGSGSGSGVNENGDLSR